MAVYSTLLLKAYFSRSYLVFGEKMKSLILIVLFAVASIASYNFMNKPVNVTDTVETSQVEPVAVETTEVKDTEQNLMSPADMPEAARTEMFNALIEYRKCMGTNKPEYHEENVRAEAMAEKTLLACDPHLDTLRTVLSTNNVNGALVEGMARKTRSKAARKLISSIMQAQAMGAR